MFSKEIEHLLVNELEKEQISITENSIERFYIFKELLIEWNNRINLTAITQENEIVIKHFVDSLLILKYIKDDTSTLIDIGTGAGFPGIPVKILREKLRVTLLDSLQKRVQYLNTVIESLNLKDIKTVHGRAEDFGNNVLFREQYDYAVARAVAKLPVLLEYCLPFVKVGGHFIAMKANCEKEIEESKKAIDTLGGKIISVDNKTLSIDNAERTIIIIKKNRQTPTRYPRKAGVPNKQPIM